MTRFNAAFKKWFGDSKITNEQDEPAVAYHGTPFDFSEFRVDRRGVRGAFGPAPDSLEGFFFTLDPKMAEEFMWHRGDKSGNIMPVYLSIQNPLITDFTLTQFKLAEFAHLIQDAKRLGHDGVAAFMEYMDRTASVIVAFRPEQIKSATGNDGTWDSDDPDIRSNPPQTKPLTFAEARGFADAGAIAVHRTEGYTPRGMSAEQRVKGTYYYVGGEGDQTIPLGRTMIFKTKIDGLLQLGYPKNWVAKKLNFWFDCQHKRMGIDAFLKPYVDGSRSGQPTDWADSLLAGAARLQGADSVILLCEASQTMGAATEVIDLRGVSHPLSVAQGLEDEVIPSDGYDPERCRASNPQTFWGRAGAGILFFCADDGTYLLTLRSRSVEQPGTWGIPGGSCSGEGFYSESEGAQVDAHELWECARRETVEELGWFPDDYRRSGQVVFKKGSFSYTTFVVSVPTAEKLATAQAVRLNWENDKAAWMSPQEMREREGKLHFGVKHVLKELEL